jgi:hypothetical protein
MRLLLLVLFSLCVTRTYSQTPDSTGTTSPRLEMKVEANLPGPLRHSPPLTIKRLIVPLSLITYGAVFQSNEHLREFDMDVKQVVRKDADFHTPFDNYLQYAPGFSVYALNAMGIKGAHNFRDMTTVYLLSNTIMGVAVQSIKRITKVQRPDGFGKNAFPSGHTATAFAGAQFLATEYKDVSPWYGIAGYAAATTTGILRMYNNKHWLRDVVAGAGFGILATETAYWLEPMIAKKLFHKKNNEAIINNY